MLFKTVLALSSPQQQITADKRDIMFATFYTSSMGVFIIPNMSHFVTLCKIANIANIEAPRSAVVGVADDTGLFIHWRFLNQDNNHGTKNEGTVFYR